jgi:hypothetical protein
MQNNKHITQNTHIEIIQPELYREGKDGKIERAKSILRLGAYDVACKQVLSKNGLDAVKFNYFVKWNDSFTDGEIQPEIWIKKNIILRNAVGLDDIQTFITSDVYTGLQNEEGRSHMDRTKDIFSTLDITMRYLMLIDNRNYKKVQKRSLVGFFLDYYGYGKFDTHQVVLEDLENQIKLYTGRAFQMNKKPLIYSETKLERYLSTTDAVFPGDCDEMIFDNNQNVVCILEYKKSTSNDTRHRKVCDQSFTDYLRQGDNHGKDWLKYLRLNILRKYIEYKQKRQIPLINVIYSVVNKDRQTKVEEINHDLTVDNYLVFDVAGNYTDNKMLLLNKVRELVHNRN